MNEAEGVLALCEKYYAEIYVRLTKEISGGLPPSQTIALGNFGWPKTNKIDGKLGRLRPTVDFKEFLFN